METVVFEEGTTEIPEYICASDDYTSYIKKIVLPSGVETIGKYAFYKNYSLTTVSIPKEVKSIGDSAFSGCSNLETVEMHYNGDKINTSTSGVVPYTMTIGSYAFSDDEKLVNINLTENVTAIWNNAFSGCKSLVEITLPESLENIGYYAFKGTGITSITIPKNVKYSSSYSENGALAGALKLETVVFEEGTTAIPDYICASDDYTSYITKVVIPDTVESIGDYSFYKCDNLTIYGYKGSYAEEYADINSIPFVSVAISKNMTAAQVLAKLDTKKLLNNISLGSATVDGPTVTIGDKTFTLFQIPTSMDIELGDKVQAKVDAKKKTIQVMIGFDQFSGSAKLDSDSNSDNYWKESYKKVKSLYTGVTGKTKGTQDLYNGFRSMRGHLRKFDASMAVHASASVAGYIEFSYASGEIVFSNGGVMLEAELGSSWDYPLPCAPAVYITFGLSAGFDGTLSLVRQDTMNYTPAINANMALKATMGMGAGSKKMKTYAEVILNGSLNVGVDYKPGDSLADTLTLKLKSGMTARGAVFGHEMYNYTRDFDDVQIYPKKAAKTRSKAKTASPNVTIDYDLEKADSLDRTDGNVTAYSLTQSGNASNTTYSESNVYKYCAPQMAYLNDGTMLLVWIDDDGTKTDANKTSLMYSVFDGASWSTAKKIGETGGANDYPAISCDGEKVQIVWQKAQKVSADASLPDLLKTVELYSVTYSNGTMGEVTPITSNNSTYEMMQSVAVNGETVSAAWVENSENDPFQAEGTNTIKLSTYEDGKWTESVLAENLSNVSNLSISYVGSKLVAAYETESGEESKIVLVQGEKSLEFSGMNAELEGGILYYTDDKGLQAYDILTKVTDTVIEGITGDFTVLDNGTNKVVMTTVYDGYNSELVYYSFDRTTGLWSDAVKLTDEKNYIRDYCAVMDKNGNLSATLNFVSVDEDGLDGDARLEVRSFADIEDVTVSETAYYDNDSIAAGGVLPLNFMVKNNGTKTIKSLNVDILDSEGNSLETGTIGCTLLPGEETEVTYNYTLPDVISNQTITIKAYTDNEVKLSDNKATAEFGFADISVEDLHLSGTQTAASLKGVVRNKGFKDASDVVVKVYDGSAEGTLIGTAELSSIEKSKDKSFEIAIPEAYFEVNPLLDGNALYVVAETTSEEADYADNESVYMIKSPTECPLVLNYDSITLKSGESQQLNLVYSSVVDPNTAQVIWSSSDDSVVTVENGMLAAVGTGKAVITAEVDGYKAVCDVIVSDDIAVTGITMSEPTSKLLVGETKQLTANVLPADATNQKVTWKSSDTDIATVSDTGEVKAVAVGMAEITATTEEGSKIAVSGVTVYQNADTVYTVSFTGGSGASGSKPASLKGTAGTLVTLPENSYEKDGFEFVGWTDGTNTYEAGSMYRIPYANITLEASWNEKSVMQYTITSSAEEGGKITPVGDTTVNEGESQTYTIKADEGYVLADVKVDEESVGAVETYTFRDVNADHTIRALFRKEASVKIESIKLNQTEVTLTKAQTVTLEATITPDDAADQQLKWTTSDINVASVSNGVVTAIGEGSAVITAEAQDGSGVKAACKVTVIAKKQVFTGAEKINKTYGDSEFDLGVKLTEGDGKLSYQSADTKVAAVSDSGKVTIKGAGTTVITVTAAKTDEYDESSYDVAVEVAKAAQTIEGTTKYSKKTTDRVFSLDAKLTKGDSDSGLSYRSSNESVVTVSESGLVTIVGTGEAMITVRAEETNNYKAGALEVNIVITKAEEPKPTKNPGVVPTSTPGTSPTINPSVLPTSKPNEGTNNTSNKDNASNNDSNSNKDSALNNENTPIGSTLKDASGATYRVLTGNTAVYVKPAGKAVTKAVIPPTISAKGVTYTVVSISKSAFSGCNKLKSVTIGKNVTAIGDKAFYNCKALSRIMIPAKVTKIGKQAFANCKKLKMITIKSSKLTAKIVGAKAFKGLYKKPVVKVPKKQKKAYKKLLIAKGMSKKAKIK